jgi:hypothetical protein
LIKNYIDRYNCIQDLYTQYLQEITIFLDYIQKFRNEVIIMNNKSHRDFLNDEMDKALNELDDINDVFNNRKKNLLSNLKKQQNYYYKEVIKRYPNIKYKDLNNLKIYLVNKD